MITKWGKEVDGIVKRENIKEKVATIFWTFAT
jgi:hypothetical protein